MTLQNSNTIQTYTNRLSVQVSLTGHSFLVTSMNTNDVCFFSETIYSSPHSISEVLEEIQSEIAKNILLTTAIKEVHVVYNNDIATVVPLPLFEETKAVEYLKFNSKILATDFVTFDTLVAHEAVVVYVPYVNINNYFFDTYGSFEYHHTTTLFLEHVLTSESMLEAKQVHIDVQKDTFTCIIVDKGALLLCNTFGYKTPEDFIYYVLFCFEQLQLNPDEIPIILSGFISKKDPIHEVLYTYIRTIHFATSKPNSIEINDQPSHHHILLKSLH